MDYPRYKPSRQRGAGNGAFSDYATFVLRVELPRLKSCRIDRRSKARALSLQKERQAA
jgi:hypothetical protein